MASPDDNELIINNPTFNKLRDTATKSGFRDGISDGRDSNFQTSFDEGYKQGFKNGFALGFYKGILGTNTNELQKTLQGNCVICKDKDLEDNPIPQLVTLQSGNTNTFLSQMKNKYQIETSINLPDKLE